MQLKVEPRFRGYQTSLSFGIQEVLSNTDSKQVDFVLSRQFSALQDIPSPMCTEHTHPPLLQGIGTPFCGM